MNVLIDGTPKVLGVAQIIDEWIKWRRECVVREYTFDLNKKGHDLNELYGFQKLLLDIDNGINTESAKPFSGLSICRVPSGKRRSD